MPSQVIRSGVSPEPSGSRWGWLLPVGTFLAGLALGAVVVGVGAVDGADEAGAPQAAPAAETQDDADADADADADGGSSGSAEGDDAGLYVRVPAACVQTADDASTLVEQVDRVVAAVADFDPERLRQAVDDVQQIRDDVQGVAEQCREAAEQSLRADDDAAPATPAS